MASSNPNLFLFVFLPQIFSQEYINLLLSMYFFVLGILALSHTIRSEGISRQPLKPVQGLGWEHVQGILPFVSHCT